MCALGNYVLLGDTPVCYGDGAEHNARCPEARRLARQRELAYRAYSVAILVFLAACVGLPLWYLWAVR